jgi:hypothetical protein
VQELINTPLPEQAQEVYNQISQLPTKDLRHMLVLLMGHDSAQVDISTNPDGTKKLSLQ